VRKRVLILHTGGTIGMTATGAGYAPAPGNLETRVDSVLAGSEDELPLVSFRETEPLIDSANATPRTWARIARILHECRSEHDGFVVLHGTDTMAYTASALSFLLPGFGKPIIVTGSQVPIGLVRSDGRQNLIGALQSAALEGIAEVGLLFGNQLLRGNRSTKVDAAGMDAFDSPNLAPLATLGVDIQLNTHVIRSATGPPRLRGGAVPHVASLRLFPGIEASTLDNLCRSPLGGLIIEAYGSGNGPSDDVEFLNAIERVSQAGIVAVVVTQCLRGSVDPAAYASGSALMKAGAVPGHDMTTEAALTKLSVLLGEGLPPEQVRRLMQVDIAGELTAPSD